MNCIKSFLSMSHLSVGITILTNVCFLFSRNVLHSFEYCIPLSYEVECLEFDFCVPPAISCIFLFSFFLQLKLFEICFIVPLMV